MIRIGIILGSTRPNRNGEQVATLVYDMATRRSDAEFELIDLRDCPLPPLDEPRAAHTATISTSTPGPGARRSPRCAPLPASQPNPGHPPAARITMAVGARRWESASRTGWCPEACRRCHSCHQTGSWSPDHR